MALTCPCCSGAAKRLAVPTIDGSMVWLDETCKIARRVNHNYCHDIHSWKATTKARKQWARHLHRIS